MKHDSFSTLDEEMLELVDGIKSGDSGCFEHLYHQYAKRVYGVAKSFYLSHNDAEEMVQEVFYKLWKNRLNLNPELSLQSYIITITRNTVIKFLRSQAVRSNYLKEAIEQADLSHNSVEVDYNYAELRGRLDQVIDQLSPQRKKVFSMVKLDGYKIDEVAKQLNLSKRTVEHHLFHASKFVKNHLSLSVYIALVFFQVL